MGAVASAVGDFVSGAVETVFEPIKQVGNIVESAVREVGHAVESVGREVGKVGQAAINDPVGTIAKVAAVASGQWWALPLVSAGLVIAHGGDIGSAALAAGVSLAAQGVAYGVGEALGSAGSGISDMMGQDAANMAQQGLSSSQIADALAQSYPEVASNVISQTADLANMGFNGAQIASDLASTYGKDFAAEAMTPAMQNALANVTANAAGAGTRTALSGGNLVDVLSSMGTAGFGTAVGAGTSTGLQQAGLNSGIANPLGTAAGAAAATASTGKSGTAAFLNSLINTTLREAGTQSKAYLKQAWDSVKASVAEYNTQLDKTNQSQAELTPLQKAAQEAETAVNAELAAYKPIRDKFSDLVKQYDDAKAAGNVELANSLADKANAMIPELDAATNKYNSVYADYDAKLAAFSTSLQGYKDSIAKTDTAKAGYEKASQDLTAESKKLTEAAEKVVGMPEPVQNAFAKMYQNGTSVDDALSNSDKLSSMSTIAQETFNRNIDQTADTKTAFDFASQINGLDTKQQTAFQTGVTKGLDDNKALEIAPIISDFNTNQQNAYTSSIKQGYGKEGADLISAFASFAPEQTTTTPTTSVTPATRDIASEFTKLSPADQEKYKQLVNNADNSLRPDEALETIKSQYKTPSNGLVTVEQDGAGTSTTTPTDAEKAATYKAAYDAGKITKEEYNQALIDAGISTPTSILNIGDANGPAGPNTGLINTGTGTGGAQLNSPNSVFTPISTGVSSGLKTYYGGDGDVYSLVSVNGVDTLVNTTKPEIRIPIDLAQVDPITKTISVPNKTTASSTTSGGSGAGGGGSQAPTPNLNPTANTDVSQTPVTGSPSSTTLPTVDFTSSNPVTGSSGAAKGPVTTGSVTGSPSASSGTGTGTGGGAGTGTGTGTGSGVGAGTGSGTGGGSGSGSGIGIGTGASLIGAGGTGYAGWQALQNQDQYGGIKNLTPGLTERMDYTLTGMPVIQEAANPTTEVPKFATGGSAATDITGQSTSGISGSLTPGLTKAQIQYILTGLPGSNISVQGHAEGGEIEQEHNPSFFSEGGLGSIENRYVQGEGDGTSDSVAAMLANGEFVIPADVVSKIGNGSNEAGAGVLDQFLVEIRKHANSNGTKLPPESKGPLAYLLDAKRKVKA